MHERGEHFQKASKYTPLYENEKNEREILQWRLLALNNTQILFLLENTACYLFTISSIAAFNQVKKFQSDLEN